MRAAHCTAVLLALAAGCRTAPSPAPAPPADAARRPDKPTTRPSFVVGRIVALRGDVAAINVGRIRGLAVGDAVPVYHGPLHLANIDLVRVQATSASGIVIDRRFTPRVGDEVLVPGGDEKSP
ncbi:MAG: hypothetical protein ACOC8F_03030 [Planctomycetota bacterium]